MEEEKKWHNALPTKADDDEKRNNLWWSGTWIGMAYGYLTLAVVLLLRLPSVRMLDPPENAWWEPALWAGCAALCVGWAWLAWRKARR